MRVWRQPFCPIARAAAGSFISVCMAWLTEAGEFSTQRPDLRPGTVAADDDRQTRDHRLGDAEPEVLRVRGQHERIGAGEREASIETGHMAGEDDPAGFD